MPSAKVLGLTAIRECSWAVALPEPAPCVREVPRVCRKNCPQRAVTVEVSAHLAAAVLDALVLH